MSKAVKFILLFFSSVIVGLYVYLGSYSQLMADDFCSVHFSERLGILRSIWYWYISWHGGYSASFADALLGLFGRHGIGFVVPFTLLIWIISLTWSIHTVLHYSGFDGGILLSACVAMTVLCITFILSPATLTAIVWWGGLRGYIPPLIIFPVYISIYLLFSRSDRSSKSNGIWYLASFAVVIFNGGFSEPFTPLQIIILFLALIGNLVIYRESWKSPRSYFLLAGILGGMLALVLMVIAPGNAKRQVLFPAPPVPLDILAIAVKSYLDFLYGLFSTPEKLSGLVGICAGGILLGAILFERPRFKFKDLVLVILTGLFFAFCCFPPAAYGQSSAPSDQSLIIPVYILVLTIVSAGFMGGQILANSAQQKKLQFYPVLALSLVLLFGYSVTVKARDLSVEIQRASDYAKNWTMRDQLIKQAKLAGEDEVLVPAIPRWITLEPNDNPKFFVNACMSLYYDINVVSAADANE